MSLYVVRCGVLYVVGSFDMGRYPQEMWPPTLMGPVSYDTPMAFLADMPATFCGTGIDTIVQLRAVRNFAVKSGLPGLRVLMGDRIDHDAIRSIFPELDMSYHGHLEVDVFGDAFDTEDLTDDLLRHYDIIMLTAGAYISPGVMEACARYKTLLISHIPLTRDAFGTWGGGPGPIITPLIEISTSVTIRNILTVRYNDGQRVSPIIALPGYTVDQVPFFEHEVGHMFPSPDKDYL